jgi:phosphoserine aminotransferase
VRAFNFSSGPGTLPLEVLEEARAELPEYRDARASVLEISHRSPQYDAIAESARASLRRLLGLDAGWHVLFLASGASLQFHQVPLNLLAAGKRAAYVVTGQWAQLATREAQKLGAVHVAASSEADGFRHVPAASTWDVPSDAAYVHFTSNNTIFGTQLHDDPVGLPCFAVCDASSDFLSRPIALDGYGLIYAGAQKNLGPAGTTVVLIHDRALARIDGDLPTILDYRVHAKGLFHTPPVFAVYLVEKVLRWIERGGGLDAVAERNRAKAELLYGRIDRTAFFSGTCETSSRSRMNVCFRIHDASLEPVFVADAARNGLIELKGYRTVGGMRASIYNAMPREGVEALVAFMDEFERTRG